MSLKMMAKIDIFWGVEVNFGPRGHWFTG